MYLPTECYKAVNGSYKHFEEMEYYPLSTKKRGYRELEELREENANV